MNDCLQNNIDIANIKEKHNKIITKTDIDKKDYDY